MVKIEVSSEIARKMMEFGESIEIVDTRGNRIGFVGRPVTDDEIAEARKRADEDPGGSPLDDLWKRIREQQPER